MNQFSVAYALASSHGHYWAVKAHPSTWAAARLAAGWPRWKDDESAARARADEAAALAASEARSASEAVWAAYDAAQAAIHAVEDCDDAHPHYEGGWIGPSGPEDYEACLVIASTRDEQGWGGVELDPDPDGVIRHTTCSQSTSWEVDPDGKVRIHRWFVEEEGWEGCAPAQWQATVTVAPDGATVMDVGDRVHLKDLRRIAECLRALGNERGARRALLLANPSELVAEIVRLEGCAVSAAQPSSGWCTPPEAYTKAAAPLRAALDVLRAGCSQQYAAKRAAYLGDAAAEVAD